MLMSWVEGYGIRMFVLRSVNHILFITRPLVSCHGSDVVGCAQPSERSARRIPCQYRGYWQAMQRRDALRWPAQTDRRSVTRHEAGNADAAASFGPRGTQRVPLPDRARLHRPDAGRLGVELPQGGAPGGPHLPEQLHRRLYLGG